MDKKVLTDMFDNLLHIGNKTNFWNPEMKSFIYGSSNGVHIIDLTKTFSQIEKVNAALTDLHVNGKKVLFVATKLQARDAFAKLAETSGNFYVTEKWVPGLLTNFRTIKGRIATYLKLLKDSETGGFDVLTKKEKATKLLELEKLDKAFRGVKMLKKLPDAIFVVDSVYESQAVREANSLGIPCFAITNTNGSPFHANLSIPANTNSVKSLDYLALALAPAFKAPVKKQAVKEDQDEAKKTEGKKAPVKKAVEKTEEK